MTDDLVAFLRARLDEDERCALDALPLGHWEVRGRHHVYKTNGPPSLPPVAAYAIGEAEHIARHDPARVLRQTAVLRDRVDLWSKMVGTHAQACLRALAAIWADHPDYREEWKL